MTDVIHCLNHATRLISFTGRDISQNSNTATTSPPNGIPLTVNVDSSACQIAQRWVQLLQAAARRMPLSSNGHDDPLPPHRILVLINPFGGKKEAVAIYETRVAPMFALAGVQATVKCMRVWTVGRFSIRVNSLHLITYSNGTCNACI